MSPASNRIALVAARWHAEIVDQAVSACRARLAERGFTGAPAITVEAAEVADIWRDLGEAWVVDRHYIKPYPVCRWVHSLVGATLELRTKHGIKTSEIAKIDLTAFHESTRLYRAVPETTAVAQYAIAFPVAAALVKGRVGVDEITGMEALLRWQHPALGMVPPLKFISIAEETGLIVPIGKWVVRTACLQNVAWQRDGLPHLCMAVNLSPRQFSDNNLIQDIAAALDESGMDPTLLELEITEGMLMHDIERAMTTLSVLRGMGVKLAIDDFGTGYSSLSQLKRFPVNTIKVDRSFVRDLESNADDRGIAQAIVSMGKSLCLTVVAEGVETKSQLEFLRQQGCDEFQGFLFSKAVPADEFADLLRNFTPGGDPDRERSKAA